MHVIIGRGNLGTDLKVALTEAGHSAIIFSRSTGFNWIKDQGTILKLNPTHIWVTAGHGSVVECSQDFQGALATHVALPMDVARMTYKDIKIAAFSSDYVVDPDRPSDPYAFDMNPKTLYAQTKLWMEEGLGGLRRPNLTVFRVGSLYGNYFPKKTFPGKLRLNFPKPCELSLPDNVVCPTPTWWVAQTIVENLRTAFDSHFRVHHVAPAGGCTTLEWGQLILGPNYKIGSKGIDLLRPARSALECTLENVPPDTWLDLWAKHNNVH